MGLALARQPDARQVAILKAQALLYAHHPTESLRLKVEHVQI